MSLSTDETVKTNGYHSPDLISNQSDDFVITGVSGRFPEANSIDEFAYNLFNGIDMVTANDRRWPEGQYGLPTRNGKLKEVDRFDAAFFNVHPKQAHNMDPQLRLLLEVTYESICDAGINPTKLRGTKTGVFIGASGSDAQNAFSSDPQTLEGYSMTGCATSMFANRLSYFFDFKGPSYTVDTACSSSLLALDCALNALRNGACDAAIVGGVNLCFRPQTSLQFLKLQMLSADGACRAFDSSGTGYVRSETVATVFIQKREDAKRLYATVLHSKTNTDGWKKDGITFPSGEMQKTLLESIYNEIHLDANRVGYVEAHGTGTRAGDPQEMNAITEVFCSKRNQPLLIGSTKSNMGHPEPASGVAALAKLLVAIQDGHIPANLHYKSPNTDIPGLTDGRLKVVTEKTELPNNLLSINSFGFGGANVHAVLEANLNRKENENPSRNEVRVALACARTADGCENILQRLKESANNIELQALVAENSFHPSHTHPYRGFTLLNSSESTTTVKKANNERRPIWFIFSGMGTQWSGMGRDLMGLKLFRQSIEKSSVVLKKYNIDLFKLILSSTPSDLEKPLNSFVTIAAIQVALVDCLKAMGVEPDGIVGHSVGELGCAYADGCFSAEETVLAAYFRGKCIQEANLPAGGMAAVGLTWAECKEMCPSDVAPACHNAVDTVTVSGPKESIEKFVEELKEKKIFAKEVACNQVAFHSHYMMQIAPLLKKCLENVIRNPPKQRSGRWISSSVPENKWNTPLALTSSPDYHVNNLCSPVLFQEALQHIPSNAITMELAPHCLLLAIIKRSLSTDCVHLNLMKRGTHDHLNYFYTNLGKLYNEGANINIMSNYEPVQYPVAVNVPFISPLIASQWDHSQQWKIPTFEMFTQSLGSAQQAKHEIDLNDGSEYSSIIGHQIDGRCLFPATGYLVLVWKTFAKVNNYEDYRQMSVLFEQVQIHRATICSLANKVIFYVNILPTNGTFEIIENNTIIVTGKISLSEQLTMQQFHQQNQPNSHEKTLQTNEIYRDFNLRGYEYSGLFRGINQINITGTDGELKWNNDWISYLDTMLQVHLIPTQGLQLPTRIDSLRIDPKLHLQSISSSTSTCSVYVDYWNSLCFSGGIELFGLHCTGTSKKNKQQNTILESYLFVPFNNEEELNNELQTCLYLILENSLTTTLALCQVGNEKLSEEVWNFYSQQPSIKSFDYTLVSSLSAEEINKKVNLIENLSSITTPVDLVIVNKTDDWEKLFSICKSNGFLLLSSDIDIPTDQLQTANFIPIAKRKNYQLWKKLSNENLNDTIVHLDEKNFQWIEQIKTLLSNTSSQRIWLLSNQLDNGILGFFNCLRREPGGQSLRAVQIQNGENILTDDVWKTLKAKDLAVNIYQNGVWGSYVHRQLQTSNDSAWIETDNAHVNVLNRGDLSSLTWLQSPVITTENVNDPNLDTCTVHYASLNFRDIMLATGKLSPEAIPGHLKMQGCLLGLEFSGLDSSGQRIMGLLSAKGLATRVAIDKRYSWRVPDNWTLEQASTIPVVYATAYYALVVRGQLKRGEKVLIHAGTGGVGTAAIAIAYSYDCEVFTTVSSKDKREYLKKLFPRLNDEHIANSRDTTFEQQIRFLTKGKGVDIVLNSLAEDKLQASVRLLAQHGRFLEIGKFDLSQNNPLGMSVFLKNTTFHGILLDSLFEYANEDWLRVHQLVQQGIENGIVQPLQSNVFNANEIEQAFRFMSQGKHMGKVVIKVYDESRPFVRAIRKTWFSPTKTYIITGGLGGFGLELTEWLVERGARNVVLCSRSGIRTGYQLKKITYLQTFFDAQISISKLNITDEKECEELIAKNLLPIGGIFHLAAVLQDGLFENLTVDLFNEVVDIKYNGTKYLDKFARIYSEKTLDYFVVFSSISCGRGNAGQTNYGYANSTMERICEQRQKDGLPALAIQWGAIGDVGMVIENLGSNDTVVGGTLPQRMTSCLETIDCFLQQSRNIPVVSSYVLAEKSQKTSGSGAVSASLIETIANILGISDASTMSADSTLADLGLDSLGSVEIKQLLEQKYAVSLANSKEIQQLTVKRLREIDSGSASPVAAAATTTTTTPMNNTETKASPPLPSMDLSQLLPKELLVLLNKKMKANKYQHLFLIHPIEGHVEMLRELAQHLPVTVFGLQSTNDVPDTSIEDIAAYYIKKIVETQPTGPYLIGGYSFGACIAVEIALQLPAIAQVLLLDGSHSYVATHTKQYRAKFNEPKHAEAAVLYAFLQQFLPTLDQKRMLSDLANLPSYDARLQFAAELLDKTIAIGTENIILIAKRFHNKLLLAEKYVPSKKIQCQTTLFRVQTGSEYSQTIGDDYGLSTVCQKPVQVLVIPGDHRTFLQGENVKILAEQIATVACNSS